MSVFQKFLRAGEGKKVKRLAELVQPINDLEPEIKALSDEGLAGKTVEFRDRLENGESLDDLLIEAYAVVREAASRVIGQRHFDVQLMGGMALHFGWIAEMKTGEGKTLVSTLPAYLNGLTGEGVHMVTVNDYLAERDSKWMGRVHRFLGLNVGLIVPGLDESIVRRQAYACDITYGTNNEFGFDYLRDNMVMSLDAMVQRGHNFAIIDEVDSILIDEARTPLIISGPSEESAQLYYKFASIANSLKRDLDYEVDEEKRQVYPTEAGIDKVEKQLGIANMYDAVSVNYVHHLNKALQAKELYRLDREYIIHDGEVKIVDEFTGRTLHGRRWSEGLHQAVEAKERVKIMEENHTWATVTLQNYFRLYDKLAGMTGTAETEAAEFANTYNMAVVPIPTHRDMIRVDKSDLIFKTELAKFNAVIDDLEDRHATGQPVLVGTASVEKSEVLSKMLEKRGIPHNVLNAKQHAREAMVVAQAGRLHAITVATNMAGRGVDILLGGNPENLSLEELASRDLDPESEEYGSVRDKLLAEYTQRCNQEATQVRELGGLYVLGSERHDSRRIDNQLRGRSGRQGDPGESRFYLSLEDDLMSRFATGAMSWVMDKTLPDDIPIEAKMVTKAVERAQGTVEAYNSEQRQDVLKYDEVMNEQRKVVYGLRRQLLEGSDLRDKILTILEGAIRGCLEATCPSDFHEEWDIEGLISEVSLYFPTKFSEDELKAAEDRDHIFTSLHAEATKYYEDREQSLLEGGAESFRQLERDVMIQIIDQRWREHLSEMDYLREGIGLRAMGQQDPLVAWQNEGHDMFVKLMALIDDDFLKFIMHIEVVPQVVQPVNLDQASYISQDDPLSAPQLAGVGAAMSTVPGLATPGSPDLSGVPSQGPVATGGPGQGGPVPGTQAPLVKDAREKLGRNEPCWCGTGQKFKNCHGRS